MSVELRRGKEMTRMEVLLQYLTLVFLYKMISLWSLYVKVLSRPLFYRVPLNVLHSKTFWGYFTCNTTIDEVLFIDNERGLNTFIIVCSTWNTPFISWIADLGFISQTTCSFHLHSFSFWLRSVCLGYLCFNNQL